nr:lipase family protein [Bradyrhizobium sp. Ai1a-2]
MHEGFRDAADAVWTQVGREIGRSADAGETLFVTGHSLGAALALATLDRAREEIPIHQAEVYIFGCPRVGRDPFRVRYNNTFGGTTYRLVHGDDIVATVPPTEFDFHHVGRLLSCARGARFCAEDLDKRFDTDAPLADCGIFGDIRQRLRGLVMGPRSLSSRHDILGALSELLSPSIGDHLPDRYIAALA